MHFAKAIKSLCILSAERIKLYVKCKELKEWVLNHEKSGMLRRGLSAFAN